MEDVFKAALGEYLKTKDPVERQKRREVKAAKAGHELPSPAAAKRTQEIPKKHSRHVAKAVHDQDFVRDSPSTQSQGFLAQGIRLANSRLAMSERPWRESNGPDGTRCGSTVGLQLDHIYPVGLGGNNSESNVRILCRVHNLLEAKRVYGQELMEHYIKPKVRS